MDILSGMKAFVATVDSGSFSQAARDLSASKATISKQVAALEDHLQVRLLHRTTRKLNLTDEGRAYVDRARRILDDLEDAEDAVSPLGKNHVAACASVRRIPSAPCIYRKPWRLLSNTTHWCISTSNFPTVWSILWTKDMTLSSASLSSRIRH
ncbi:MAG: LysR family transcriptional regulator [Magnetovibrio sp.]|nr:LysR family transcriptional regulator [Magnetovibrio sp.]